MIYVASPYSHSVPQIRAARAEAVTEYVVDKMHQQKDTYFSPITYGHQLSVEYKVPEDYHFWSTFCLGMLDRATSFQIYCLPNWDFSIGITEELAYANRMHIPISYVPASVEHAVVLRRLGAMYG